MRARNFNSKITDDEVLQIRKLYEVGAFPGDKPWTQNKLCQEFGLSIGQIGRIVRHEAHRHLEDRPNDDETIARLAAESQVKFMKMMERQEQARQPEVPVSPELAQRLRGYLGPRAGGVEVQAPPTDDPYEEPEDRPLTGTVGTPEMQLRCALASGLPLEQVKAEWASATGAQVNQWLRTTPQDRALNELRYGKSEQEKVKSDEASVVEAQGGEGEAGSAGRSGGRGEAGEAADRDERAEPLSIGSAENGPRDDEAAQGSAALGGRTDQGTAG